MTAHVLPLQTATIPYFIVYQFNLVTEFIRTRNIYTEPLIRVGSDQHTQTHKHAHTLAQHVSNRTFRHLTKQQPKKRVNQRTQHPTKVF